ncbi:hypothetical protein B9Z19DRAFT_181882 [Tuber borchii]|uniref:Uncharacterized protein n=1 Tax=Tuber borchii TaxID=42251 RepID=A0A2T6ZNY6_TUBBO|nr:hypothetical protein B9Z19DRAFT_181882 [Tuber borchii]
MFLLSHPPPFSNLSAHSPFHNITNTRLPYQTQAPYPGPCSHDTHSPVSIFAVLMANAGELFVRITRPRRHQFGRFRVAHCKGTDGLSLVALS